MLFASVAGSLWVLVNLNYFSLVAMTAPKMIYVASAFPFVINHYLLIGILNLIIVIAVITAGLTNNKFLLGSQAFKNILRAGILIPYSFAALSKLNTDFLFGGNSCAYDLIDKSAVFLGVNNSSYTTFMGFINTQRWLPFLVAAIELAVPILLLIPRTRMWGILLVIPFHLLITFSPTAPALGFTMLLVVMMIPFLTDAANDRLALWLHNTRKKVGLTETGFLLGALGAYVGVAYYLTGTSWSIAGSKMGSWVVTQPATITMGALIMLAAWKTKTMGLPTEQINPVSNSKPVNKIFLVVAWGIIVATTAVATMPYLAGQNIPSFSMYSNIQIDENGSNHILVPHWPVATILTEKLTHKDTVRVTRHMGDNPTVEDFKKADKEGKITEERKIVSTRLEIYRSMLGKTKIVTAGKENFKYVDEQGNEQTIYRDDIDTWQNHLAVKLLRHRASGGQDGSRCQW